MDMLYLEINAVILVLNSLMALDNVNHVQIFLLDANHAQLTLNLAPHNVILVILNKVIIFLGHSVVILEPSHTLMMEVVILVRTLSRVALHAKWMLHPPLYVLNVILKMDIVDMILEKYAAI